LMADGNPTGPPPKHTKIHPSPRPKVVVRTAGQ
jgi:hypothetical protein